jgi:hypothetical protein
VQWCGAGVFRRCFFVLRDRREWEKVSGTFSGTGELSDLRSQFATSSSRHRGATYRPWAFSEHGALMAANILRSDHAVQMSIYVIRAFVRLREHVAANQAILRRLAEIDKALLQHDASLRDIYRKLLPLLQPPLTPAKRRIGFLADDGSCLLRRLR